MAAVILHVPKKKWDPKAVVEWIKMCREEGGIPIFKTKYAKVPFDNSVMAVCWGGKNETPTIVFTDVPKDDLAIIETETGEWKYFLKKYGFPILGKEVLKLL